MDSDKVKEGFEIIKQAMIDDNPSESGSYAHSWHCNISCCCADAMQEALKGKISNLAISSISNDAASRFMKLCFNVETQA